MDRNLTLEAVRLTEAAALYASRHMGKGDAALSYKSASDAMARVLSSMNMSSKVVIGVNREDTLLVDGAHFSKENAQEVELAVKPLDGRNTCARGGHNALSAIALGHKGSFMKLPEGYSGLMNKIAVGSDARGVVDINQPVDINIKRVARAKGKYIEDITVCVLDRDIHKQLVEDIRNTGARIRYLRDGDISAAISTAMDSNPVDMLMGVGGTKEGIIAAAALQCLGGDFQGKLISRNKTDEKYIKEISNDDKEKIYGIRDLVLGEEIIVSVTGVTDGVLLPGVRYFSGGAETSSILLRQKTHTLRVIKAVHHFDYKPVFD